MTGCLYAPGIEEPTDLELKFRGLLILKGLTLRPDGIGPQLAIGCTHQMRAGADSMQL